MRDLTTEKGTRGRNNDRQPPYIEAADAVSLEVYVSGEHIRQRVGRGLAIDAGRNRRPRKPLAAGAQNG